MTALNIGVAILALAILAGMIWITAKTFGAIRNLGNWFLRQ